MKCGEKFHSDLTVLTASLSDVLVVLNRLTDTFLTEGSSGIKAISEKIGVSPVISSVLK